VNIESKIITDLNDVRLDCPVFMVKTVQDYPPVLQGNQPATHPIIALNETKPTTTKLTILADSADTAKALLSGMISTSRTERALFISIAINDEFVSALAKALETACHTLHALHLIHTTISPLGVHHLMTGLILHGRLRTLDLSDTPSFGDAGCARLAALLPDCPTLRELSLRGDRIGPDGAAALAQALAPAAPPASPADTDSSLSARLSSAPARRSRLESLDLRRNVVGDAGAAALAAALARGAPLRELDVSGNWVTGRGAEALAAALRGNRRLRRLTVRAIATDGQEGRLGRLREEEERGPAVSM
jgi:hypothetical protein